MNRKLFAFFALVGLTVAPSTTWALGSNHYAQLDLSVIGEKGGLVCATTSSAVPESGFGVTSSSGSIKSGSTSLLAQDITIYAHAQVDEGWEFLGWFDSAEGSGSPTSTDNPYKCVIKASSTSSGSPTTKSLYAKFRDPSVKIPLSEVTFNLNASSLNYTGSEQSVSISEVSYSGSGLTKDVDYMIDPSSILSATGSLLSNETYKVIINAVDGSDYTGSATNEWTIVAPSGEFAADALSTTASGCGLVDGAIKVTDSTELEYVAENKWKANAVIKFPFTFPTTSTTQDDPKVKYIDEAHALIESTVGSVTKDIKNKQYKAIVVLGDHNYIDTITWTVDIPLEDVKAAAAEQKTALEYEISVGALAWTHYTSGLKPTTYKIVVPLTGIKLLDQWGNQLYPNAGYVAQVDGRKMYKTLAEALAAADATNVVALAATEKADFTIPQNVTVNLEGFGNGEATYLLAAADNALGAKLVSSNAEEVATQKGFEIVTNFENDVYTYTLQKGHIHAWGNFKADGNVLTATCTNYEKDCTIADRTITLTLTAEDKAYDGKAPNAGFDKDEKALFEELLSDDPQHMLSIGEVGYTRPDYSADKWYTGKYTAFVTVQIGGVDYRLEKEFSITKPEGGYTDGFEAAVGGYDVRFNTFAEAASVSTNNATVYYRGGDLNQQTIYFSSAKNITLDLRGKTLTYEKTQAAASKLTIQNGGAGTVTLVNGTIQQPKGQEDESLAPTIYHDWKDIYYGVNVSGKFIFGDDMEAKGKGMSDDAFLVINAIAEGSEKPLEIVSGLYAAKFAGGVEITGGDFAKNPEEFLADGYALGKEKVTGYPFHVFEHTHDYSFTAEGAAITCHCTVPGCYYDGVSTELKAEDVLFDGESHGAWLEPAPGDGFPNVQIGITYKTAEGEIAINGIPSEIGEYIATATVGGVSVKVRYRITDGRPFDLSAIKPLGGEATGRVLERSTLTVTNGVALKYCTADEAPDGSGVEGWYIGMKVTWPNGEAALNSFSRPEDAKFTMNGIKGEDGEKRIFTGQDAYDGKVIGLSAERFGVTDDLSRITSFTWWERIVVTDVKAADKAGVAAIERELTAWGEPWKVSKLYYDEEGVAEYTFKIVVNLKDLKLSDGTYTYWPEHAHDWSYEVNDHHSITAKCSIVDCPYSAGVWAEFGPKTVASRLGSPEPLEAEFAGIEKFIGATDATVGEIEYYQGDTKLEAAPIAPGLYQAKVVLTLADGTTTYDFITSLEVVAGEVVVDGQHYEKAEEQLERKYATLITLLNPNDFNEDLYISVGKDFTAGRTYEIPGPTLKTEFPGMATKYFDLNGFSITGAVDAAFFENKGKLVLSDSSEGQTGRMMANPENTEDVPLIINRAGKATELLDFIESYGAELTIESGIYLGAISNEVGEVVEILGKSIDLSGKIVIKGGKFLYRPERAWLDKGCYIVEETLDDGTPVFAVYPHQHEYKFVSLGSLAIGYCTTRDEGQGLLEPSSCQAKVVLMSALMQDRAYNGQSVECKEAILSDQIIDILYAILYGDLAKVDISGSCYVNLSALFSQSFLDELIDSITEKILDEAAKSDVLDKIKDGLASLRDLGKDEIKVDEKACLTQAEFEELTGATVEGPYWTTNASLIDEIFGDEDDESLDGAPRNAGAYKVCFDIQTPSTNTVSVKNPFKITPLPIEEVEIATVPATNVFIYSSKPTGYSSVTVKSQIDGVLQEGADYVIGNVTNATNVGDYFFQVIGTRNYEGVTNIYWSIIKPVRPFPTDALEATEEGDEKYGVVNGPMLSVVNAPAIEYSVADQGWWVGYTINWPCEDGNKTLPKDAQLIITYPDWYTLDGEMVTRECTVADILAGDVALDWGGPFAEESCRLSVELDGDYVKLISWSVLFTPEDLYIAHDEGKLAELDFTIKAGTRSTDTNTEGLKETDFALVVPLGNLELYDVNGYRVFPTHLHTWQFEKDERGWLLSAHCVSDPKEEGECELDGDPWMTLGRYLNEEIEYTGKPVKVRKMNEWEFRFATGAIVGEVEYFETNDLDHALAEAPFQVGTYAARVVVTPMARKDGVGNEPFVLERTFKIVKPLFGYADGFEVKSTARRYDTYAEAVATLTGPGDTIYCHEDIEKAEIDLTTPYNVTIDLCDKIVTADAEMTIKNAETTTVTLENGTVIQPRHYALKIIQQPDQAEATGKFVFGRAFRLRNVALLPAKHFTVTIPKDSSLEVTGGSYNAKFDDGTEFNIGIGGGKIEICGGLFGKDFKPASWQIASGYEVREALGEFAYIVVEKGLSDEEFTQKLADSVVESVDNDVVRGKLAEILAKSAIKADEIFDWIKEKIGDLRQNLQEDIQQEIADIINRLFNSEFLKAAFDLNTGILDGQEVAIKDYKVAEDEITFRVTAGTGEAQEVVQTTAAKIAPYVQVTTSLTEPWTSVDVQNISIDESGLVHVARPADEAAYMRIALPKD